MGQFSVEIMPLPGQFSVEINKLSFSLVSDQFLIGSGVARVRRKLPRL